MRKTTVYECLKGPHAEIAERMPVKAKSLPAITMKTSEGLFITNRDMATFEKAVRDDERAKQAAARGAGEVKKEEQEQEDNKEEDKEDDEELKERRGVKVREVFSQLVI